MAYCTITDLLKSITENELIALSDDRETFAVDALDGELVAAATSITLVDSTSFPSSGRIEIDNEIVTYTTNSGTILAGCTRGSNNTVAVIHATSAIVTEVCTLNTDVIERVMDEAEYEINAYCSQESDLPFTTVPDVLITVSVTISLYRMYLRRQGAPDFRVKEYDDAIRFLTKVSKGDVKLLSGSTIIDDEGGPSCNKYADDLVFTRRSSVLNTTGSLDNY